MRFKVFALGTAMGFLLSVAGYVVHLSNCSDCTCKTKCVCRADKHCTPRCKCQNAPCACEKGGDPCGCGKKCKCTKPDNLCCDTCPCDIK